MRHSNVIRVAAVLIAGAAALAVPGAAEAAPATRTTFVVDTQFIDGPSDIVAATGALAACTTAQEGDNPFAIQTGPSTVLFTGTKTLDCVGGTVTIAYEANLNFAAARKTFGTWEVVDSTLAGVSFGGGRLTGDSARCEIAAGSEGCILDTFTGNVFA